MIRVFVFSLLFFAAFKNDMQGILLSEYWFELAVHPFLSLVKRYSWMMLVFSVLVGMGAIFSGQKFIVYNFRHAGVLIFFAFVTSLVSFFYDVNMGVQALQAALILLFIYYVFGVLVVRFGVEEVMEQMATGFLFFSMFYIFINFINFVGGYGFVPGNLRYFGTATHPNFIGVNLAICNLIVVAGFKDKVPLLWVLSFVLVGVAMQVASGSRTSFVMLCVGLMAFQYAGFGFKVKFKLLLPATVVVLLFCGFLIFAHENYFVFFERGESGGDTRSVAWINMLLTILDNPWFGVGGFVGYSENSYLRVMVAYGIFFGTAIGLTFLSVAVALYRVVRIQTEHRFIGVNFSLCCALLVGGVLEGYLADLWSFPKLIFYFLALSCVSCKLSASSNNCFVRSDSGFRFRKV